MKQPDRTRERLIMQARHLIDELDALSGQIASVPKDVLSTRPIEGELSIKEMYALIGLYDRHVYLPALEATASDDRPLLEDVEDADLIEQEASWNGRAFSDVLQFTREARTELVRFVESLEPERWNRRAKLGERNLSVFDLVYAVIQHDAELLRAAAQRFHDSRLSP